MTQGDARLLLASVDRVGDLVWTLPALEHVRARRPDAEISFLASADNAGLLEGHPAVDRLFALDWSPGAIRRRLRYRRFLRTWGPRHPDALLLFGGATPCRWLRRTFPGANVHRTGRARHRAHARMHAATSYCGPVEGEPAPRLPVTPERAGAIDRFLTSVGVADERMVVLHPGASRLVRRRAWPPGSVGRPSPKTWPTGHWRRLIAALRASGLRPVLTGMGREAAVCRALADEPHGSAIVAVDLHVLDLAALLARAAVVVCGDTGPGHVAAAVGTPLVSLFGPTDPAVFGPLAPPAALRVLRRAGDCASCATGRGAKDRHHTCMQAIEAEDVLEAIEDVAR